MDAQVGLPRARLLAARHRHHAHATTPQRPRRWHAACRSTAGSRAPHRHTCQSPTSLATDRNEATMTMLAGVTFLAAWTSVWALRANRAHGARLLREVFMVLRPPFFDEDGKEHISHPMTRTPSARPATSVDPDPANMVAARAIRRVPARAIRHRGGRARGRGRIAGPIFHVRAGGEQDQGGEDEAGRFHVNRNAIIEPSQRHSIPTT